MAGRHVILVAGGEDLYLDLRERFPRAVCDTVFCETLGQSLDRSATASVIVIDLLSAIAAVADDLVRRLRADPVSAKIPIVVRVPPGARHPRADHVVSPEDAQGLIDAVIHFCPELADPAPAPKDSLPADFFDDAEADFFDIETSTVVWRKQDVAAGDQWPPEPPEPGKTDDLEFCRTYAGYVNSLVEAYDDTTALSAAERTRLDKFSAIVVDTMDEVLGTTQRAVNGALMKKNLGRMRELSAARNVLYEKLQRLRAIKQAQGPTPATRHRSDKRSREVPLPRGGGLSADMAEAAAAAAAQVDAESGAIPSLAPTRRRASRPHRPTGGTARRRPGRSLGKWLGLLAALGLLGAGVVYILRPPPLPTTTARPGVTTGNRAPQMRHVILQQTRAGVVARGAAVDPEGDPINYLFRWRLNGTPIEDSAGTLLEARRYHPGVRIEAIVTPTDRFSRGLPMISQPLTTVTPP